jgi:uncharacterized ferritin-like protein (DUF455 family)
LISATKMPRRSPFTDQGHAALLHSIVHIELNAIDLALDALLRFGDMPAQYYLDWLQVAKDEARHFSMLLEHLQSLGYDYGDFPAHDGLWSMCEKTGTDILARMALVPRTLEARGLDATPQIQARLVQADTPQTLRSAAILDIILADEIRHVAIGNHWYRWLCERRGLDPVAQYTLLARQYNAPALKPPFNEAARRLAGFSEAEISHLRGSSTLPDHVPF